MRVEGFNVIIDQLVAEMVRRKQAYGNLYGLFQFLFSFENTDNEKLREDAKKFAEFQMFYLILWKKLYNLNASCRVKIRIFFNVIQ